MRIGVDVRPLADEPRSGVGEYALQLLGALLARADGDTFSLFANRRRALPPLPADWPVDRYTVRKSSYPNKLFNASLLLLRRPRLETLVPDVDCFFAPNLNFMPPSTIPLILTVHDLSFHHYARLFSWRRRIWHRLINPRALIERAAGILAVSRATADDLHRTYGVPMEKIRVVHSGVRIPSVTDALLESVRSRFALGSRFLFSLATFEPRKNFATVLEVFSRLREDGYEGELVLAGAPGWSQRELTGLLAGHPHRGAIHLLGYVSDEEKAALYRLADCFLYLSVFEGFGFPPLEALVAGTPVVCGHHTSLPEVAAGALFVDVHNPKDVAVAVAALLRDQSFRDDVAGNARMLADRYSWSRAADETHDALHAFTDAHAHRH